MPWTCACRYEEYPKLKQLIEAKDAQVARYATPPYFLRADLKALALSPETFGTKFDVILVDPPWEEYARRAPGVVSKRAGRHWPGGGGGAGGSGLPPAYSRPPCPLPLHQPAQSRYQTLAARGRGMDAWTHSWQGKPPCLKTTCGAGGCDWPALGSAALARYGWGRHAPVQCVLRIHPCFMVSVDVAGRRMQAGSSGGLESWTWQDIVALDIDAIADTPCFLFLWCGAEEGLEAGRVAMQVSECCHTLQGKGRGGPGLHTWQRCGPGPGGSLQGEHSRQAGAQAGRRACRQGCSAQARPRGTLAHLQACGAGGGRGPAQGLLALPATGCGRPGAYGPNWAGMLPACSYTGIQSCTLTASIHGVMAAAEMGFPALRGHCVDQDQHGCQPQVPAARQPAA